MSGIIHIISWERFCQSDNLNDLDKYAQFLIQRYPGLLEIRNLNTKQSGPHLQELPKNCLSVLIEKSSLLLQHRNEADSISGVDVIFKMLCLIARNYNNIEQLIECGTMEIVIGYMDLSIRELAKEIDMEWLNLFEYLSYFLEIVYDPTFSWRRRKRLYYSDAVSPEDFGSTVKPISITNEITTWMCSQLSNFSEERDLFNRLLHLLCSILSGSKSNAQLLISPSIVDTFSLKSDVNAEIIASLCCLITCLSNIPLSQRQENLSCLVSRLLMFLTEKSELRIHELRCLCQLCDVNCEMCEELIKADVFSVLNRCIANSHSDKDLNRMSFFILSKITAGSFEVRQQFLRSGGYDKILEILISHVTQSASLMDLVFSWAVGVDFDASKVSVSPYTIRDGHVVSLLVKWGAQSALSLDDDQLSATTSTVQSVINWKAIFKLLMELCCKSRHSTSECCECGVISVISDCIKAACKQMDDSVPEVMDYGDEHLCKKVADSKRICDDLLNGLFHLLEMFSSYSVSGMDLVGMVRLFKDKHARTRGRRIIKMFNNIVSDGHQNNDIDCWFELCEQGDSIVVYPTKDQINFTLGLITGNFGETIPSKVQDSLDGKISPYSFSFHCWLNITAKTVLEKVNAGHERSCIFRLLSENLNGFEAFLNMDGQLLIATCHQGEFHYVQITAKSSSKKSSFFIEENLLKYNKWHMLDIVFQNARNFFSRSTVSVYIDGLLINTVDLKYPQIAEKISVFHIGGCPKSLSKEMNSGMDTKFRRKSGFLSNSSLRRTWFGEEHNVWGRLSTLKCRMVTVACLNDALTEQNIAILYNKGPATSQALLADEQLSGNVVVNYHSLAFDRSDNCCRNLHPYILSSKYIHYLSGYLHGAQLSSIRLKDAINEIGGVSSLLPIIEQLDFIELASDDDFDSEDGYRFKENSPTRFVGKIVSSSSREERFISVPDRKSDELLGDSILASIIILLRKLTLVGINQQLMERSKCIEIIGCFLQKIETIFLDMNVVIAFHALADQCSPSLSAKIYQLILFDWRIWTRCNIDTRLRHCMFVVNLVKHELSLFRNQYGVGFFLDVVLLHHRPYQVDGIDVNKKIRKDLYDIVYGLIHKHLSGQDLQKLVKFIHECNDDSIIQEILELLTRIFESERSEQDSMLFYESKLMDSLFVLLIRNHSIVTKEAVIKFLHLLISSNRVPDKCKDHILLGNISFASIFTNKQFYDSPLSAEAINSLLNILRKAASKDLFGVIQFFSLLTLSPIDQRVVAMTMLKSFFEKSPDSIFAISQQPGWQDILIHLLASQKRVAPSIIAEKQLLKPEYSAGSYGAGFNRSSTWVHEDSFCENIVLTQSNIDEISERDDLPTVEDDLRDPESGIELKSSKKIFFQFESRENSVMDLSKYEGAMKPNDSDVLPISLSGSVSGSEDIPAMSKLGNSPCYFDGTGGAMESIHSANSEELIDIILECLQRVLWSVLMVATDERSWMTVHQVLESLRSVNDRYVLLRPMFYIKQRILIGLLNSIISHWKANDSPIAQYRLMHSTELIRLIVDSNSQSGPEDNYHYEAELLERTTALLQDYLLVWSDDSDLPELTALGYHYLLSLSCSAELEIVSAVCACLHHVITSLSKDITYDEIAFILVHLDRVLVSVIDSESFFFIAPILKTLLEHHEDMLQVTMYLGNLAIRTPEFYDYFKDYCRKLEWKTFIKSRLYSACEVYESSYLNGMTTGQSLWRAQANEQMSVDRKRRGAICKEHKKRLENDIIMLTSIWTKEEVRRKEHKASELQMQQDVVLKQWRVVKQSLTSSKGCWRDEDCPNIVRLKQSCRENSLRMRPRFEINYQFDDHLDASRERDHPRRVSRDPEPDPLKCLSVLEGKIDLSALGDDQLGDDEWISVQNIEQIDPNHNINHYPRTTAGSRKSIFECRCKLIAFTDVVDGKFELTNTHFLFHSNTVFTDSLDCNNAKIMCPMSQIREVHLRRYNLRRSAIEIFLIDQTNYFFNFDAKIRDTVYSKILSLRPPNLVYSKQRSPADMLKSSGLTQKWINREISNFEYLMQLNTIAGRTYNDLSQYPVFPWIIADYTSPKLDLSDSKTFRDLSKPIGVVNPKNENEVREKYDGFEDPSGVIAKFHYGTHYSSAAGVMHYMVRMEPYTTMHIQLQGGKFDVADRQFYSIPLSWRCIMECPSDNKELVPEFFYQPQFLRNDNDFNFGKLQQSKTGIDDVELPAWASSPEDFIYQHRQALESEHVSMNLHNWIDLIFGYKQKGAEAVKALNVFYYVTYEGVVDLDQIENKYEREAIESMINNFGQTPCQLLKTAHPRRMTLEEVRSQMIKVDKYLPALANIRALKHTSKSVCSSSEPITFVRVPPGQTRSLIGSDRSLGMVTIHTSNMVAKHTWTPNSRGTGSGYYIDIDTVFDSPSARRRSYLGVLHHEVKSNNQLYAITPDCRYVIAGGNIENCLTIMPLVKRTEPFYTTTPHHRAVSCVALDIDTASISGGTTTLGISAPVWGVGIKLIGISGSLDSTCVIWDWSELPSATVHHVLYGHSGPVTSVSLSVSLDVALAASTDGSVNIHSVTKGLFLHSIRPGQALSPNCLAVNFVVLHRLGHIYVQWQTEASVCVQARQHISVFSLHGNHISTEDLGLSPVTVATVVAIAPGVLEPSVLVGTRKGDLSVLDGHSLAEQNILRFSDPVLDAGVLPYPSGGQYLAVALASGQLIISAVSLVEADLG